jgi:hypothetical protein
VASEQRDDVRLGVYRGYKGEYYLVIGIADDANADEFCPADSAGRPVGSALDERTVVVYVPLYVVPDSEANMAVRTFDDFNQMLCTNRWEDDLCYQPLDAQDRCLNHGRTNYPPIRRFEYVGGDV